MGRLDTARSRDALAVSDPPSEQATVRRLPERARYDQDTINDILDEGMIAHVGMVAGDGRPVVIPMVYARRDNHLLLHGAPAAGILHAGRTEVDLCVTVTLLDGLVLARSAFHHSMNYRSVVIHGRARLIADHDEREAALDTVVDHLVPGRRPVLRPTTAAEIKGTAVLELALTEASAKVRTGQPVDDDEDYELNLWAGVLPLRLEPGAPVSDPALSHGEAVPDHVARWRRGG